MAQAAVCSKVVVLLLLSCCLVCFPLVVGVLCLSLFCCALLCVLSCFAIILKRKRERVALLWLSYRCLVTIPVLWLFVTVPWVSLRCVIVVFPDHIHLLFFCTYNLCVFVGLCADAHARERKKNSTKQKL